MITVMLWPMNASPITDPAMGGRAIGYGGCAANKLSPPQALLNGRCPFAGNDIPGVMLASAVRDYVVNFAVSPGDRTVVVTNNDDAYRTALCLLEAGLEVPMIVDARPEGGGALMEAVQAAGIRVALGRGIAKVKGGKQVTGVQICTQAGEGAVLEEVACDVVAMSGGWSPVVHLWSHCGGKLIWDAEQAMFRP